MDTKQKFKIILIDSENAKIKIWAGKCTWEELNTKFHDAIKVQIDKYNADPKRCQLRAYDDAGMIVAQETFHGKSKEANSQNCPNAFDTIYL